MLLPENPRSSWFLINLIFPFGPRLRCTARSANTYRCITRLWNQRPRSLTRSPVYESSSGMFGDILGNSQPESFPEELRCFSLWVANYVIFLSLLQRLQGTEPSIRHFQVRFVKIEFVGNTPFWLFLHILSPRSKEKRKGLQIHFNLGCLFSLRWKEC